jgi:D-cysteine desulfhydrase
MLPLFRFFPNLEQCLPHVPLGDFPTPVKPLQGMNIRLHRENLYTKCDDVSALPYGGNKVRKLEFLLADAKAKKAVRVITSGAAGSNHALATALYAKKCGLAATLILFDQPPSRKWCTVTGTKSMAGPLPTLLPFIIEEMASIPTSFLQADPRRLVHSAL